MNDCVLGIALRGYTSICGIQGSMGDSAIAPVAASVADQTIIANNCFFDMR